MERVILKRKERYLLNGNFYKIIRGSVTAYDIFENGKSLPKDGCFKNGDFIGNFFGCFDQKDSLLFPETEVEIVALEDNTILENFTFSRKEIGNNIVLEQLILRLARENIFKLFQYLYDKKGYILAVLKFSANDRGYVVPDYVHPENFNMSRSQFYSLYTKLKNDRYVIETKNSVQLDLEKVQDYFLEFNN